MQTIDELDTMQIKRLTNKLLAGEPRDVLADEFKIELPLALTIRFVCPSCEDDIPIRVVTKDMGHVNRYIKCPKCRNSSYLSTIQTVNKDQKEFDNLLAMFSDTNE